MRVMGGRAQELSKGVKSIELKNGGQGDIKVHSFGGEGIGSEDYKLPLRSAKDKNRTILSAGGKGVRKMDLKGD